ncbi:MAG: ATP-binding protein [Bacteroidales bacterium]|nr:ATP-binding protein [Bacteroidales bacterium]
MDKKEYKLEIDPRILELLGPSLYTNIYYVLAELIANAYDADAKNVYIFDNHDNITIEDDGRGMSYVAGDVKKYLNVAGISRSTEEEALTPGLGRRKMGRKGVGKLAALSVSKIVKVLTIHNGEKSGFILSRHPDGEFLPAIDEDKIVFSKVKESGTSIIMTNPEYALHKSLQVIKMNILKIFPLVGNGFTIHIIRDQDEEVLDNPDETYASQLCALITLGQSFSCLAPLVPDEFPNIRDSLVEIRPSHIIPLSMEGNDGITRDYSLEIKGWIGTYKSTRGRKAVLTDFPDNFISLFANNKMGEFNILPLVGQNKMNEVFVVGQLHIDLFEETMLPDMALSNRQGYKTDDPRYVAVINYVRNDLLPSVLEKRSRFAAEEKKGQELKKISDLEKQEAAFRQAVVDFKEKTSQETINEIAKIAPGTSPDRMKMIVDTAIETHIVELGIKPRIDSQKKKLLISHTKADKALADIVYKMLIFNNVPAEIIIYTNCDDEMCRIPEGVKVYNYLKRFFVDSYSDQKMYVLFVTSDKSQSSWGALVEVGAAWITSIDNKIFNIPPGSPQEPLDNRSVWQTTNRDERTGELSMDKVNLDVFCVKIEDVCKHLGYPHKERETNRDFLRGLVAIV